MSLDERIAYLREELKNSLHEKDAPSMININRLSADQRAQLQRNERILLNEFNFDLPFQNKRISRYTHTTDGEDYSMTESQTQPNASMTIEAIYKRISQGKPITDTNLMDLTSSRDGGYDTYQDRDQSLQDMWDEPFTQPLGTLDRVQEVNDRVRHLQELVLQQQQQLKQQQQQQQQQQLQQAGVTPASDVEDYAKQRAEAKANKQAKK